MGDERSLVRLRNRLRQSLDAGGRRKARLPVCVASLPGWMQTKWACITSRAQELCESQGGRPGLPVPNKPTVSVDVKQHSTNKCKEEGGGERV